MPDRSIDNIINIVRSIRPLYAEMTQQEKREQWDRKNKKVYYINRNRKGQKH